MISSNTYPTRTNQIILHYYNLHYYNIHSKLDNNTVKKLTSEYLTRNTYLLQKIRIANMIQNMELSSIISYIVNNSSLLCRRKKMVKVETSCLFELFRQIIFVGKNCERCSLKIEQKNLHKIFHQNIY